MNKKQKVNNNGNSNNSRNSNMSALNPSARAYKPPGHYLMMRRQGAPITTFPQIKNLQDELVLHILSFVADVPYESSTMANESNLTHRIPLVSKHWKNTYSKADCLWKEALFRLVEQEPKLWGQGLKAFLARFPKVYEENEQSDYVYDVNDFDDDDANNLVHDAGKSMERVLRTHNGFFSNLGNDVAATTTATSNATEATTTTTATTTVSTTSRPIYCELYRHVLFNHIRYTSPLFYMPDHIQLGQEFGLHFFEPRYRLLIAEAMSNYPQSYRDGGDIEPDFNIPQTTFSYPTFIYAHKSPLKRETVACIVQVKQCTIHQNGTADVFLTPTSAVRIEHVWERPNSHHLYEARVMLMGEAESYHCMGTSRPRRRWQQQTVEDDEDSVSDESDDPNRQNVGDYIRSILLQLEQARDAQNAQQNEES